MNPFEQLCVLASGEKWCWKLNCTTCGHVHFRYAFREVARGKSPVDDDWVIHWSKTQFAKDLGPSPRSYSKHRKSKMLEICVKADLTVIASRCNFPDWLGYLGLIIAHMKTDEEAFSELSSAWSQQLSNLVRPDSAIYERLHDLSTGPGGLLNLDDLENIECAIQLKKYRCTRKIRELTSSQ